MTGLPPPTAPNIAEVERSGKNPEAGNAMAVQGTPVTAGKNPAALRQIQPLTQLYQQGNLKCLLYQQNVTSKQNSANKI